MLNLFYLELIYLQGGMKNYITGTSIPNLDINGVLSHRISMPSPPNAKEIGTFIKDLKELISLKAHEIRKLNNLKDSTIYELKKD